MLRNYSYVVLVVLKAMEKSRYEMLETDLITILFSDFGPKTLGVMILTFK